MGLMNPRPGRADKKAQRQAHYAAHDAQRQEQAFWSSAQGQARIAFQRGDHVFEYSAKVERVAAFAGGLMGRKNTSPTEVLNAISREGWELVSASMVYETANAALNTVNGETIGYYVFKRAEHLLAAQAGGSR
ncbi:hypothetical protein MU582_06715 [Nocardioidaceae bacterium SCSIO 66511]|nr:hypothetical protein MU582_06715 [Nocardioidaceae bacterium SCSIO 66511]